MFFAVRGNEANIKCDECSDYFLASGMWPTSPKASAVCPCGCVAYWKYSTVGEGELPRVNLAFIHSEERD